MKTGLLIQTILFILIGATQLYAQGTGVRTEYLKDDKSTKVETNMLYLGNTTDQFVGLQLTGRYKGEKLTSAPKIEVTIYSFSKDPIFKKDKDRILVIIADGTEMNLGTMTAATFKGETKNGADTYFAVGGNPNVGMQVPLPQGAAIRLGGSMTGMTMELLTLQLRPDQFLKLGTATNIRFKVGSTILTPTNRHVEVIHNFAQQLTPQQGT
jgi:hypothetical protein